MERYVIDYYLDEEYEEGAPLLNRVFSFYPKRDSRTGTMIELWNTYRTPFDGERRDRVIARVKEIACRPDADQMGAGRLRRLAAAQRLNRVPISP